jgi:hypothetical protein
MEREGREMTPLNILAYELATHRDRLRLASEAAARTERDIAATLGLGGGACGYRTATVEDWIVSVASLGLDQKVVRIEKREG